MYQNKAYNFFPIYHPINVNYSPAYNGLVIEIKLGSKNRIILKFSGKLPKAEINRVLNYTVAAVVGLMHVEPFTSRHLRCIGQ